MSKKEAISLIHEIFASNSRAQDSNPAHLLDNTPFDKRFETFLEGKFIKKFKAIEAAYNLLDAAQRYNSSSDCKLFLMILQNELPEDSWANLNDTMDEIKVFTIWCF